jgi:hypothetical protein
VPRNRFSLVEQILKFEARNANQDDFEIRISNLAPLSLPLFMLGVLADDMNHALAADNLAVVAQFLY